ncbi:MAG: hypothetical protein LBN95_01475 [Prevotellaceae bacterium]|jgi:hypothetical protein|nr:hypothetical protein [Prevotellaceae bacterium]
MNYNLTKTSASAFSSTMEREPISKNRVIPKNVRSRGNFFATFCVLIVWLAAFSGCTTPIPEPEPETPFVPDETTTLTEYYVVSYGNYYQNNTNNCGIGAYNNNNDMVWLDIVSTHTADKTLANGKYKYEKYDYQTDNSTKPRNANTFGILDFHFKNKYYYDSANEVLFAEFNISDAANGKKYELNVILKLFSDADKTDTVSISFIYEGDITNFKDNSSLTAEDAFAAEPNTPTTITRNITGDGAYNYCTINNKGNNYEMTMRYTEIQYTQIQLRIITSSIPYGIYQINDSGAEGTVMSTHFIDVKYGLGDAMMYAICINDEAEGYNNVYYLVSGTLTIGENEVTLQATSYFGTTINITYTGTINYW